MHVSFIPYGERGLVEGFLRQMEAQKHILPMIKGKKKKGVWIPGQLRQVPFGVYEYVFPKEDLDIVLKSLEATNKGGYNLGKGKLAIFRKILNIKKVPNYSDDKHYLWEHENVSIIVLGIREDAEVLGTGTLDKGWTHEAI